MHVFSSRFRNSLAWCHCSYIPRLAPAWLSVDVVRNMSGQKTKPTQHSATWPFCLLMILMHRNGEVKALLGLGNRIYLCQQVVARCPARHHHLQMSWTQVKETLKWSTEASHLAALKLEVQTLSLKKPGRRSQISSGLRMSLRMSLGGLRCTIPPQRIISAHDVANLFHVPGHAARGSHQT